MSYFVAGLTNASTAPVYTQYHHVKYNAKLPASATASVSFPPSDEMFRYVIIQQPLAGSYAICLAEVKVFLRGTVQYISFLCRTILTVLSIVMVMQPESLSPSKKFCSCFCFFVCQQDNFF